MNREDVVVNILTSHSNNSFGTHIGEIFGILDVKYLILSNQEDLSERYTEKSMSCVNILLIPIIGCVSLLYIQTGC